MLMFIWRDWERTSRLVISLLPSTKVEGDGYPFDQCNLLLIVDHCGPDFSSLGGLTVKQFHSTLSSTYIDILFHPTVRCYIQTTTSSFFVLLRQIRLPTTLWSFTDAKIERFGYDSIRILNNKSEYLVVCTPVCGYVYFVGSMYSCVCVLCGIYVFVCMCIVMPVATILKKNFKRKRTGMDEAWMKVSQRYSMPRHAIFSFTHWASAYRR